MARESYTANEAARILGISLDTLRRWDRLGRIETTRDARNHRRVAVSEVERLRGASRETSLSARNRLRGTVTEVKVNGLIAQIEILVSDPARLVAIVTADAAAELDLRPGMPATAVIKATSMMVEH